MSFHIAPSMIQVIAQSINIPSLSNEAAQALAPDVEYRLREIIQEAAKFMRHSRRSTMTTVDIDNAVRVKNVEPLYGFGNKNPSRFVRAVGHPDVFYVEDRELTIEQVVEAPLPQCPVDIGVMMHWLAVNGVQPSIPENAPLEPKKKKQRSRANQGSTRAVGKAVPLLRSGADGDKLGDPKDPTTGGKSLANAKGGGKGKEPPAEDVQVRVPVKHELSRENQLYFQRIQAILESVAKASNSDEAWAERGDTPEAKEAQAKAEKARLEQRRVLRGLFAGLACDPGLNQLMPYLRHYITEKVSSSLKDLAMLSVLLKVIRCLLTNPHADVETHLAQLMPAILTCLVAQRLGPKDGRPGDHWRLRREAADLVAIVCRRFGPAYPNLQTRITRQLEKALADPARAMSTHYGAVVGLSSLGPRVTKLLVLPHAAQLLRRMDKPLGATIGDRQRLEAHHLFGALQTAAGLCMRSRALEAMDLSARSGRAAEEERLAGEGTGVPAKEEAAGGSKGLEEAWRESSDLRRDLDLLHQSFGDALLPFVPAAPVVSLFL